MNKQSEHLIICFTNPLLNASNWLCALASQLHYLESSTLLSLVYIQIWHVTKKGHIYNICVCSLSWLFTFEWLTSPHLFLFFFFFSLVWETYLHSLVFLGLKVREAKQHARKWLWQHVQWLGDGWFRVRASPRMMVWTNWRGKVLRFSLISGFEV